MTTAHIFQHVRGSGFGFTEQKVNTTFQRLVNKTHVSLTFFLRGNGTLGIRCHFGSALFQISMSVERVVNPTWRIPRSSFTNVWSFPFLARHAQLSFNCRLW